jgi:hypothetical protein
MHSSVYASSSSGVPVVVLIADPPPLAAPDAGVIEDARRRQRRRWEVVLAALAVIGLVAGLSVGGIGGGRRGGGALAPRPELRLTFEHGSAFVNGEPLAVGIAPDFTAGQVSLLVRQEYTGGTSSTPYPTRNAPLFGPGASNVAAARGKSIEGELYVTLVGSDVASVRITGLGTFRPVNVRGALPGDRAIVFYRPAGSRGTVLPPGIGGNNLEGIQRPALFETAYNAAGKQIPITSYWTTKARFRLASRYWHAPAPPAGGRRAVRSSLAAATPQWGEVAQTLTPDDSVSGPAFLSCLNTWYRWRDSSLDVGVLLNAQSPGSRPAALWNATPLSGTSNTFAIKSVTDRIRVGPGDSTVATINLAPGGVAKRVGAAWIVVRGSDNTTEELAFLNALQITRLDVR